MEEGKKRGRPAGYKVSDETKQKMRETKAKNKEAKKLAEGSSN
jgi:hypothetical protein